MISPLPLERSAAAVAALVEEARRAEASEIAAVGTMALREAKNASVFVERVRQTARIDLKVISGDEEARLSHAAVRSDIGLEKKDFLVFDTGGGSTEFIYAYGAERTPRKSLSIPIGVVQLTERFFQDDPVAAGSVPEAEAFVKKKLSENGIDKIGRNTEFPAEALIGVGGAVTTLASVRRAKTGEGTGTDGVGVHGSMLEYAEVAAQAADYAAKTLAERKAIAGLLPERADIVLAGACVVKAVMEILGMSVLTVSARGLRHGLMSEMMNVIESGPANSRGARSP
jgi:exopolyphosphatase/guanosine-5'-triphosphate,3'-diphosphate pyrophosphatase